MSTRTNPKRAFTLIESAIAMAILLLISLSILPMFTRSMAAAHSGREKTDATSFLRLFDEILALPLGEGQMMPPQGEKVRESKFFWCQGDIQAVGDIAEGWFADATGKGHVLWDRSTTTRQFSIRSLDPATDGQSDLQDAEAIAGGDRPENVHFVVTDLLLDGRRKAGPLGPAALLRVRQIRAF